MTYASHLFPSKTLLNEVGQGECLYINTQGKEILKKYINRFPVSTLDLINQILANAQEFLCFLKSSGEQKSSGCHR